MRRLILIRHAAPQVTLTQPARTWPLSAAGRDSCTALGEAISRYEPDTVVASIEPKAAGTGRLVAEYLELPFATLEGLSEQRRVTAKYEDDPARFAAQIQALFDHPASIEFGEESANAAHARLSSAVDDVMNAHARQNVAIVTHATVLTLYLSRLTGEDPFALWQRWGLPGFAVLSWPDREVIARSYHIDSTLP